MAAGRWRSRWSTLRGWFPLTWGGLAVIAGSVLAFRAFGQGRQDLILLIVGLVGLLIAGWCLLATVIGGVRVWWALRDPAPAAPLELECGRPGFVAFRPPTLWGLPFVSVEWTWRSPSVDLSRGSSGDRIVPRRRGVFDEIERTVEVGDVFGLALVRFAHRQPAALRFLPATGGLRDMRVIQGLSGGDQIGHPEGEPVGDRIDMRRYGEGDPIRYVLWKVYARSRELMVRTPERAFSPARQTIAYLVAGAGDEAAAGAARVAVESGAMGGDWRLGVDGASQIADAAGPAMDLILRSAGVDRAGSGAGLQRFMDAPEVGAGRRAMVFVPATPGPWLDRVCAVGTPSGPRVEYLVCVDGLKRRKRPGLGRGLGRLLLTAPNGAPADEDADWEGLQEVLRALGGRGEVMIVDRAVGAVYPATQLQR